MSYKENIIFDLETENDLLFKQVEKYKKDNRMLLDAISFYADITNYMSNDDKINILKDKGALAREAQITIFGGGYEL